MALAFQFDAATHTYTADGAEVPSVTQVLERVGISDFSMVPPATLEYKAQLGTAVHAFCHYLDEDDEDWGQVVGTPAEPYCRAYESFLRESGFRPRLTEHRGVAQVNGQRYGFCLDREGDVGGHATVIDLKTGASSRSWGIQLAAYELALFLLDGRHRKRMVVRLGDDGQWRPVQYADPMDEHVWRWALALENWKRNHE